MKTKIQTLCAWSATLCSFMFGFLAASLAIERHDPILIPFAIIGVVSSVVMFFNRK